MLAFRSNSNSGDQWLIRIPNVWIAGTARLSLLQTDWLIRFAVKYMTVSFAVRRIRVWGMLSILMDLLRGRKRKDYDMAKNERKNYKISVLECTVCHKDMYVPRRFGKLRPRNHIKTMYCPYCDKKTDFIETGDTL